MSKLSKALTITMALPGATLLPASLAKDIRIDQASAASPATTVKVLNLAKGGTDLPDMRGTFGVFRKLVVTPAG
jgi:hypothetical protein